MNIRPFKEADRDALIALWRDCLLVVPWNDPDRDIDRKLAADPEGLLVGEIDGDIVATAMAGYEGHRGWVNYLAVAPARRREGLGRAMMAAVEALLAGRGCPKVNLQVRTGNSEVIDFYEALGYRVDAVVGLGKRLEID